MKKLIEEQKKRIRYMYSFMFRRYKANVTAPAEGGTVSDKPVLGAELIPDASRWFNIDNDPYWNKIGESTISGGIGNVKSTVGALSHISRTNVFTIGKTYRVSVDIKRIGSGAIAIDNNLGLGSIFSMLNSVGTHSTLFTASGTDLNIKKYVTICDIDIDNISVKEVLINSVTTDYLKMAQNNRIDKSIRFGWLGEAGSKIESGKVSKLYDINCFEQLGSELVTNGDFSNGATGWSIGNSWSLVNGVLINTGIAYGSYVIQSSTTYNSGKTYLIQCSVIVSGVEFTMSNGQAVSLGTAGFKSIYFTPTSDCYLCIQAGAVNAAIDNISFREVYNKSNQNNATQTTPGSRPYLTGNIAPNEKLGLKNPNRGSNFMTHPTISFSANESWSVTTVLNWNGGSPNDFSYAGGGYRTRFTVDLNTQKIGVSKDDDLLLYFDSLNVKNVGKNSVVTITKIGDNISLFINGVFKETKLYTNASFVFQNILAAWSSFTTTPSTIKSHIIRSQALTPTQVTAEYDYLRSVYPEIESVVIGTQTWATSNCEMAATPQGNVIAEMQAAANVEKITNAADRDFSSDTLWWAKDTGVTIADGVCHFNNVGINLSLYKVFLNAGKYNKLTFTISNYVSGSLKILGTAATTTFNANGTYTIYFLANQITFGITANVSGTTLDIDNISVQEIGWSGSQELYDGIYAQTAEAASSIEKITNAADRDFSSDTGFWSKGANVTIDTVAGVCNFAGGANNYLSRNAGIVTGRYYKMSIKITNYVSGTLIFKADSGGTYVNITGNGTYNYYSLCNNGTYIELQGSSDFIGSVDNLSCKELGLSDATSITNYTYAAVKAAAMWCHYNNSVDNGAIYGKLYNWFAVKLLQMDIDYYNTANPTALWGWRVPTQADFTTLSTYLGGEDVSGGKLKLAGTTYWNTPNAGADNSSGFSAIGSGERNNTGSFSGIYNNTHLSAVNTTIIYYLIYNNSRVNYYSYDNKYGHALRLIKS